MLDYRAQSALCKEQDERTADLVNARRIRKEVLVMCDNDRELIIARQNKNMQKEGQPENDSFSLNQQAADKEQLFWILINRAEANYGLGNIEAYDKAVADAELIEHDKWMMDSLNEQIAKLKKMITNRQPVKDQ